MAAGRRTCNFAEIHPMKSNLLALLCCVAGTAPLVAQNFPFPTANAEWITTRVSGCAGGSDIYNSWREYLGGDTVLQNKPYQKLYLQPECTLTTQGTNCDYSLNVYQGLAFAIGALREEDQRVYFQKFELSNDLFTTYEKTMNLLSAGIDILLYDFNWQIGDTLAAEVGGGAAIKYAVTSLSTLPNGRKKYVLTHLSGSAYTYEIIEGAGNSMGLFANYINPTGSSYLPVNGCFHHNGAVVFTSTFCTTCGSVAVAPEPEVPALEVYPNPASDRLSIVLTPLNSLPEFYELQIYNLQGQLLYGDAHFSGQGQLSVAQWPAQTALLIVLREPGSGQLQCRYVQLER